METPASTGRRSGRRAALALVAIATALPLLGTATPSAGAAAPAAAPFDPGDAAKFAKLNKQIEQLEKELGGDLASSRTPSTPPRRRTSSRGSWRRT